MINTLLFTFTDFCIAAAFIISGSFLFGLIIMPFIAKGIIHKEDEDTDDNTPRPSHN
ncbi:MAG: hypothetical protein AB7G44_07155 [Bacteroidia bacterium]